MEREMFRRLFGSKKSNLKYFLELYLGNSKKDFEILGTTKFKLNKRIRKVFLVSIRCPESEEQQCIALLNPKIDGFTLFFYKNDLAIKYKVFRKPRFGKMARIITYSNIKKGHSPLILKNYNSIITKNTYL